VLLVEQFASPGGREIETVVVVVIIIIIIIMYSA